MKKKGFTLVELLAVIVIIGIIAVISTPIIFNVISVSKEKAVIEKFKVYIEKSAEVVQENEIEDIENFPQPDINGCYNLVELDPFIEVQNDKPNISSDDKICIIDGNVTEVSNLELNGYILTYVYNSEIEDGEYNVSKN